MRDLDELFAALAKSKFRSRFRLSDKEQAQLADKALPVILDHARELIVARLAPAEISNDGRQTPMRGHPVFVAQHATATCCRGCLRKWHFIQGGVTLEASQVEHVLRVIQRWLQTQQLSARPSRQGRLFD